MEIELMTYGEYGEELELAHQLVGEMLQDIGFKINLSVIEGATDGFRVDVPDGARVCFDIAERPDDADVRVGRGGTAVTPPFRLETLGPCDEDSRLVDVASQAGIAETTEAYELAVGDYDGGYISLLR